MFILKTTQRNAIPQTENQLKEKIEPGDIIHTAGVVTAGLSDAFNLLRIALGENEIHTQYAVSYNDKTYILNTHMKSYFNEHRKKMYKNPESVSILASNDLYVGFLEPLDEFLHILALDKAYVRIVKTRQKAAVYDSNQTKAFSKVFKSNLMHCTVALGKYLETRDLISNRSGMSDILYYTPDVVREKLGVISNTLYQLK
jgi:hypothetical protein